MDNTKKEELFPYFAYLYSQQLDPEKYGQADSIEEWTNLIQSNEEDINAITAAAEEMSDEEWAQLEEQYIAETQSVSAQFAAKGAKLKKLKGGGKKKKCSCGCDIISRKVGGKIVDRCSCGCEVKQEKTGGKLSNMETKKKVIDRIGAKKDQKPKLEKGGLVKKQTGKPKGASVSRVSRSSNSADMERIITEKGNYYSGYTKDDTTYVFTPKGAAKGNQSIYGSSTNKRSGPYGYEDLHKTFNKMSPKTEKKVNLQRGEGGKVKNRIQTAQTGAKFSKKGEKPTSSDTISKYNRMHGNSDGYGPTNNQGKELKTKSEILKTARKEWKGKKVDVNKIKGGGKTRIKN